MSSEGIKKVEFFATLQDSSSAIAFGRDGSARVRLEVPASHAHEVVKLLLWTEVPLKVTVEPDVTGGR